MTPLLITLLIGASAGILLGTAGAKIQAAAHTRLAWPQGANFLRLHLSSGFVIVIEIVTAAIALALPSARPACFVLALVYAAFVVGATTLRGQECGCFGIDGMTVGPVHIGGCALASACHCFSPSFQFSTTFPILYICSNPLLSFQLYLFDNDLKSFL